jgi:hypothetical protein
VAAHWDEELTLMMNDYPFLLIGVENFNVFFNFFIDMNRLMCIYGYRVGSISIENHAN